MTHTTKGAMKYRAGAILTTSALIGASFFASAGAANADPAPDAPVTTVGAGQNQTVVVPDGVCSVNFAIGGGYGGLAVGETITVPNPDDPDNPSEEVPEPDGARGSGALISGHLDLRGPGVEFGDWINEIDVSTGGNGVNSGAGGLNGGGNGGIGGHQGGGGGGYTTLTVDGMALLLAGGGGGSGGGHQSGYGAGGNAGYQTDDTVAAQFNGLDGVAYNAKDGGDGMDLPISPSTELTSTTGGGGGTATNGGAGGTNPRSDTSIALGSLGNFDGFAGTALQGGNGGYDGGFDTAGGGGGGLFGGGGGASSEGAGAYTGSGGGGGASWIANEDLGGRMTGVEIDGNRELVYGPDGTTVTQINSFPAFAEFEWVMCDYALAIEKNVVGNPVYEVGATVRYAVTVTNNGVDPMVFGDTVTLTDDLAAGGTLVSVTGLDTSDPEVGEEIPNSGAIDLFDDVLYKAAVIDPDTLEEIAPAEYKPVGLAVGESVTIEYDVVITQDMVPATGDVKDIVNTVSTTDRASDEPVTATATVVPAAPAMELTKTSDVQRATAAGQKITYSFVVKNTGNIALEDVAIAEGEFSGKGTLPTPTCPTAPVAPGASTTCTAVYTVLEADLTGKDLTNTATASASTPMGAPVESNVAKAAVVTVVPLPNTGGEAPMGIAIGAIALLALGGGLMLARRRSQAAAK